MADEKTIKIKADFGGSIGDGPSPDDGPAKTSEDIIKELLSASTFSTTDAPADPIGYKPIKPGMRPVDREEEEPEEEETTRHFATLNKVLAASHKVIIGLNGANGRVTKAFAVIRRSIAGFGSILDDLQGQTKTATTSFGILSAAAKSNSIVWNLARTTGVGFIKTLQGSAIIFGKILGGLGITVGIVAGAMAAVALSAKLFSALLNNLVDVAGQFSGALEAAKAATQVSTIQQRIKSANQVGGELAGLQDTNREIIVELIKFKTEVIDLLSPFLEFIGEILIQLMRLINGLLAIGNFIWEKSERLLVSVLESAEWIPVIGAGAKAWKDWINSDEIRNAQQNNDLNLRVEEIFNPSNFRVSKNKTQQRFLPPRGP